MFYPQQSPAITQKLSQHPGQLHDGSPWSRAPHHGVLGPPSHVQPPTSPGYPLFTHTSGGMTLQHHPHMPGPMVHHHHQGSLSHAQYQSPPNGNGIPGAHAGLVPNGSPVNVAVTQIMTPHWQNQLMKCEMIRASRSPHHRARASAMASRTVQKSAIPIQKPHAVKPPDTNGTNGATKEGDITGDTPKSATSTSSSAPADSSPSAASATASHPSSTVAPIAENLRPTANKPPENTWTSLDMGGVNIKNIPPNSGLFSFTFLLNLYLNHNALTRIPVELTKLRHLELLDLSGNSLTEVPPEMGMLTSLKEFYLFDNHLTTLPAQLGTLHQLQTLGIEGNPLDPALKLMIQEQGTPALIAHLRDVCSPPDPPSPRVWRNAVTENELVSMRNDPDVEIFTVLCYNILCEKAATERMYGYTASWALAWKYRRDLILGEVKSHKSDFICLQEVDSGQYEEFFRVQLEDEGYEGVYWPKSRYKTMSEADRRMVDGCATFYKKSKYTLVEKHLIEFSAVAMQRQDFKKTDDMFNRVLGKDHIAVVCLFENKESGTRLIVVNTHIHWDPLYCDVKLVQVALLVEEVEKIAANFAKYPPRPPAISSIGAANGTLTGENNASSRPPPTYSDGTKIPLVVCGDFNSIASSGVCEFLSTGSVPPNHPDFMSHLYGKYTEEGLRHRLGLRSAYAAGELPMTNFTPTFKDVIDYVWYSTANLAVNAVLGEVEPQYIDKVVGFPNAHFPSDHLCIVAEFRVKPPKEAQPPRPPPVFPDSSR